MIEALNNIADRWFAWELAMLWQVVVLVAIIWAVDLVIRKWAWPQVRYAMWLLVLVKLVLPPTLTSPTSFTAEIPFIAQEAVKIQIAQPQPFETTEPVAAVTPAENPQYYTQAHIDSLPANTTTQPPEVVPAAITLSWKAYALFIWVIGIVVLSGWLIIRLTGLRREHLKSKQQADLPDRFTELLESTTQKLNLKRVPQVILTNKVCCPAVFGVFKPLLLIPADKLKNLTRHDAEHVLLHELAHIKRGDLLIHAINMILQIAYWFNPLLWLIRKQLQNLRELCCDATVARLLREKTLEYRGTLLETAKQLLAKPVDPGLGLLGLFENSNRLVDRLKWLEKKTWRKRPLRIATTIMLLGVMLSCIVPMARADKEEDTIQHEADTFQADQLISMTKKVKPPFVFKIHTVTPGGEAQPGVQVKCLHPRSERGATMVDMVVTSDQRGVAEFHVTEANIVTDRYFWFSLADDTYVGSSGGGISPVENEYEYTFRVLPSEEFRIRVVDDDDKSIPNAKLWLMADHVEFPHFEENVFEAMTVVHSDAYGMASVRFARVKTNIVASAEGYASIFLRGVSLSKEEPYEVRLSEGYEISGKLFDQKNNPVKNAQIVAKRKNFPLHYTEEFILNGVTDAQGRFALKNAPEGEYEVQVRVRDLDRSLYVKPALVGVGKNVPAAQVELQAEAGVVLKGRYLTKHNIVTANWQIFVTTFSPMQTTWELKTEEDGSFVIQGLPPDSHGIIHFVGLSGFHHFVKMSRTYPFFEIEGEQIRFRDVPPGAYEGVEAHFLLEGRATGLVADSGGRPLTGVEVIVRPNGHIYRTDDKGLYSASIPPDEDVTLEVRLPTLRKTIFKGQQFKVGEGEIIEQNLKVPAESVNLVDLKPEFTLSGQVVDKDGKGVADATVHLGNTYVTLDSLCSPCSGRHTCPVPPTWKGGSLNPAYVKSSPDGSFLFNLLLPGKTDVWAEHPDLGWGWTRTVDTNTKDVRIKLKPQPEKLTFSGKIIDAEDNPVADTDIRFYVPKGIRNTLLETVKSNDRGQFKFEVTPPWAHFKHLTVLCVSQDSPLVWRLLPYCSGRDLRLKLKQGTQVSGRVVNSDGDGVGDAAVNLYMAEDPDYGKILLTGEMEESISSVQTDRQGNFTLGRIPVGSSVSLKVGHAEYGTGYAWRIPALRGAKKIPDIKLPEGVTIEGLVCLADTNEPAQGVTVQAKRFDETIHQTVTDAYGRYRIKGLDQIRPYFDIFTITAQSQSDPPDWTGQIAIEKELLPGDLLKDADILLHRTLIARQTDWRRKTAKPLKGKCRVAVLHNSDPQYNGKQAYEDTLTLYNSNAKQIWQFKGLNVSQSVGAKHTVVYNPFDKSLWCSESVGDRLVKFGQDGSVLWEKPDVKPQALAVDPKTANIWVLTSEGTIYGKSLVVFNPSGRKIHQWDIGAFDIVYSQHDDCFWLVGKKIWKLDRNGSVLYQSPYEFAWLAASVDINQKDGSVWIIERKHPQVAASLDRVLILDPDGKSRSQISINRGYPTCVVVDGQRHHAWVATTEGLLKLSLDGKIITNIPLAACSICLEPDTGCVWVASRDGLYRLDPQGKLVRCQEQPGGSQKLVCILPQNENP